MSFQSCPFKIWCCGDHKTATISVGVTNIISLVLLTAYYIGTTIFTRSFGLNVLVVGLLVIFLVFINAGLIYGATKRYKWLYLPWMIVSLPAILALLIYLSLMFLQMEGRQIAGVLLLLISAYFYVIVVSSYIDLNHEEKVKKESNGEEMKEIVKNGNSRPKEDCLIDLTELENLNSTSVEGEKKPGHLDETFSVLATRPVVKGALKEGRTAHCSNSEKNLNDSGEFTLPLSEDTLEDSDFNFSTNFNQGLLPVPEEVISIPKISSTRSQQYESGSLKAHNGVEDQLLSLESEKTEQLLQKQLSSEKLPASDFSECEIEVMKKQLSTHNSSQLLGYDVHHLKKQLSSDQLLLSTVARSEVSIDASFTPFKKINKNSESLPKMKVFLPKDSSSSEDSSSSSSEENIPLKASNS